MYIFGNYDHLQLKRRARRVLLQEKMIGRNFSFLIPGVTEIVKIC